MKALVVDDSQAMRSILKQALFAEGYEVLEASHGKEALDVLDDGPRPDVVFVDLHMPRMNGLDFVRAVRGDRRYDDMRIVVASSECEMERIDEVLAAGADEYLMKPFHDRAIAERLELLDSES